MNWIALGTVTELIAALAFLASFLFIKQQMKQNHDVTKASHQREILNASRDFFALTRSNPEVFKAVATCMKQYESADAYSRHVFTTWVIDYMLIAEQAWYMKRDGFINEASYEGFENLCMSILVTDGGQKIWPVVKDSWGKDASEHFQKRMDESGEVTPKHYDVIPFF